MADVNNSTESVDIGALLDKDNFSEEMAGGSDEGKDELQDRKKKLHQ
jgi:hypothetical protein